MPRTNKLPKPVPIVQVVQSPGSSPGSVINRGWKLELVGTIKNDLGVKAIHRDVLQADGTYALREPAKAYGGEFTGKNESLRTQNTLLWDESFTDPRK